MTIADKGPKKRKRLRIDVSQSDCCEMCGGDSRVTETRGRVVDGGIRRARRCMKCSHRWMTIEVRVPRGLSVVALPVEAIKELVVKMKALAKTAEALPRIVQAAHAPFNYDHTDVPEAVETEVVDDMAS